MATFTVCSSSLNMEDIVRLLGSSGMPMTSESWAELSAHAALVASRLRELENNNTAVESTGSSISHDVPTSMDSTMSRPTDPVQIYKRDLRGMQPSAAEIPTRLAHGPSDTDTILSYRVSWYPIGA